MQDAGGQHSYCPAYLRAPACRHGLLARQRAIVSRKEQQAFLALLVVTPLQPCPTLILSPLTSATGALDQRQPRSLAALKLPTSQRSSIA